MKLDASSVRDSVGARTQDLLLRRQLLYPAELRNLQIGCKITAFLADNQIISGLFLFAEKRMCQNEAFLTYLYLSISD